jgi:hypothetical protein
MPRLSIISHFYGHPERVLSQIEHWSKISPDLLSELEFILVDDCSEVPVVLPPNNLNLRLFRITTDIPWNQGGARNLGAFQAKGDWALFFDIDQKLELDTLGMLLKVTSIEDMATTMFFLRIRSLVDVQTNQSLSAHPNTFLVNLSEFKNHGMYDEDFSGHYGYEDLYLNPVWEKNGGRRILLDAPVFFEDLGFGTTNFNRDVERNKELFAEKVRSGARNSPGILRFEWQEVAT